jgi:hypothetical protein
VRPPMPVSVAVPSVVASPFSCILRSSSPSNCRG